MMRSYSAILLDYADFFGSDPAFHNWVKDLFLYYWEKAQEHNSLGYFANSVFSYFWNGHFAVYDVAD
jgi:regulator of sigma D